MGRCVHEADEKWGGESKGADEKWGGESVTPVTNDCCHLGDGSLHAAATEFLFINLEGRCATC